MGLVHRGSQVFGSGMAAWLSKAVLWMVVGLLSVLFAPEQTVNAAHGHAITPYNCGVAFGMAIALAVCDGILMLVIGGILVAIARRRMTWRGALLAGAIMGGIMGWLATAVEGTGPWGLTVAGLVLVIELAGAAVGVGVWRRMQPPATDAAKVF